MPQLPKLPSFQTLPFRVQVAVVVAALALVGVGGYAGLVAPKKHETQTLRTQLLRQEPAPIPGQEAPPPITEEERKLWKELEARLQQRFPSEKDLPGALKALAELARSARMELVALSLQAPAAKSTTASPGIGTFTATVKGPSGSAKPGGPGPSAPVLPVPPPLAASSTVIKLAALHRYRDLVQFLDGLEGLPVVVAIESLEVRRVENRLSTEMTLRTLVWKTS